VESNRFKDAPVSEITNAPHQLQKAFETWAETGNFTPRAPLCCS
jgi:hypothetical protein